MYTPPGPPGGWPPQGPQPPYPNPYGPPPPQVPPPKKTSPALIAIGVICASCFACGAFSLIGELVSPHPNTTTQSASALAPEPAPAAPGAPAAPSQAAAPTPPAPVAPEAPAAPAAPPPPADDREFVTDTCARVAHLFGPQSRMTDLQQEELWRRYDQRWVRWRVRVGEISNGALGGLQMQFKCSGEALIADGSAFFPDSARERLLQIHPDEVVTLVAQLKDHGQILGLSLDDASLE